MNKSLTIILFYIFTVNSFSQNIKPDVKQEGHIIKQDQEYLFSNDSILISYYKLIDEGILKCNKGQYKESIIDFSNAINLYSLNYKAYLNRSVAYSKIDNYSQALIDINFAISLDSMNYELFYNRGVFYKDLNMQLIAVADFEKSIKINPNFSFSYLYLGECNFINGNLNESLKNYDKAISLDSTQSNFYYSRSVYFSKVNDKVKEIIDLKKVIELDTNFCQAYNNLGYSYFSSNFLDSAIYFYTKAIKCDNENLKYRMNRVRAYEHKKQYQNALNDLNFVIKIDPKESYFYKRRSEIYLLAGQKEKAINDFKKYNELK
jgi:tetratricopeptide (TPR) repeat protein